MLADLQNAHDDTFRDDVESMKSRKWRDGIVAALDGVATKHHLRFDPKGASARVIKYLGLRKTKI